MLKVLIVALLQEAMVAQLGGSQLLWGAKCTEKLAKKVARLEDKDSVRNGLWLPYP